MLARIRRFFAPPIFEGDEDKTRTARFLNVILWANLAVWFSGALLLPVADAPLVGALVIGIMILVTLGPLILMRLGRVQLASGLFSAILWALVTGLIVVSGGVTSPMGSGYLVVVIVAGMLAGGRAALLLTGLSTVAALGLFFVGWNGLLPPALIPVDPIAGLSMLIGNLLVAGALLYVTTQSMGESLGRARRSATELEEQREHLEEMVEERTYDLARRTRYLEATAAIARDATSVLDLRALLSEVVNLVSEQLDFYHTGIFLLHPGGKWAVLEAASSEGGQRMLARGHRLEAGVGIVGTVVAQGRYRIASDVGLDAVFFDNPDLPDTRSEMALPLRARGEVIGALDVQSVEPAAFSAEDVAVLQTLADQVAVAISNARLFEEAQESLEAERRAYGEMSRAAWQELIRAKGDLGVLRDEHGLSPLAEQPDAEVKQALRTGRSTVGGEEGKGLAIPIRVRGQVIGAIDAHKPDEVEGWTAEQAMLMETLAEQLGDALEDARLYEDVQRRATSERLVGEVVTRMRESLEMDTILRTAAREMQWMLDLEEVEVRMGSGPMDSPGSGGIGAAV